jgi:predicted metal-dependent hydrolase
MDREGFALGLRLFNAREFFEAHEVLEEVWRAAPAAEKKFLQGIIQIAVALHHSSRGNLAGAQSLMRRAASNLSSYPDEFGGICVKRLLCAVHDWREATADGAACPPVPRIERDDRGG